MHSIKLEAIAAMSTYECEADDREEHPNPTAARRRVPFLQTLSFSLQLVIVTLGQLTGLLDHLKDE